jgi:hypothetical protein
MGRKEVSSSDVNVGCATGGRWPELHSFSGRFMMYCRGANAIMTFTIAIFYLLPA